MKAIVCSTMMHDAYHQKSAIFLHFTAVINHDIDCYYGILKTAMAYETRLNQLEIKVREYEELTEYLRNREEDPKFRVHSLKLRLLEEQCRVQKDTIEVLKGQLSMTEDELCIKNFEIGVIKLKVEEIGNRLLAVTNKLSDSNLEMHMKTIGEDTDKLYKIVNTHHEIVKEKLKRTISLIEEPLGEDNMKVLMFKEFSRSMIKNIIALLNSKRLIMNNSLRKVCITLLLIVASNVNLLAIALNLTDYDSSLSGNFEGITCSLTSSGVSIRTKTCNKQDNKCTFKIKGTSIVSKGNSICFLVGNTSFSITPLNVTSDLVLNDSTRCAPIITGGTCGYLSRYAYTDKFFKENTMNETKAYGEFTGTYDIEVMGWSDLWPPGCSTNRVLLLYDYDVCPPYYNYNGDTKESWSVYVRTYWKYSVGVLYGYFDKVVCIDPMNELQVIEPVIRPGKVIGQLRVNGKITENEGKYQVSYVPLNDMKIPQFSYLFFNNGSKRVVKGLIDKTDNRDYCGMTIDNDRTKHIARIFYKIGDKSEMQLEGFSRRSTGNDLPFFDESFNIQYELDKMVKPPESTSVQFTITAEGEYVDLFDEIDVSNYRVRYDSAECKGNSYFVVTGDYKPNIVTSDRCNVNYHHKTENEYFYTVNNVNLKAEECTFFTSTYSESRNDTFVIESTLCSKDTVITNNRISVEKQAIKDKCEFLCEVKVFLSKVWNMFKSLGTFGHILSILILIGTPILSLIGVKLLIKFIPSLLSKLWSIGNLRKRTKRAKGTLIVDDIRHHRPNPLQYI